jgi:hypothetical protein
MKIGKAHQTQSSSLYSANTIGAQIHPAPIGVADRTGKNIIGALCLVSIAYWRRGTSVRQYIGAQRPHCANILALRDPPAPIYWRSGVPCANSISISISIICQAFSPVV